MRMLLKKSTVNGEVFELQNACLVHWSKSYQTSIYVYTTHSTNAVRTVISTCEQIIDIDY